MTQQNVTEMPVWTDEQQKQLDRDVIDREPIGADEILLVGDLKYGVPVLKIYFDEHYSWEKVQLALERGLQPCQQFLTWARGNVSSGMRTLREVQRIRELVRESPPVAVDQAASLSSSQDC